MENSKTIKLGLIFLFLLFPFQSFAYKPTTTHAGFTQEIVDFYNFSKDEGDISKEIKELIIQGSIEEDSPSTRAINHFYDPIRNIGLYGMDSAKYWAMNELGALGETKLFEKKIEGKRVVIQGELNDFTWPKILHYYATGDEIRAYLGLGHILHLIEDMGVPDHTRNDPHMGEGTDGYYTGESPYENWTGNTQNRETMKGLAKEVLTKGEKIKILSSLESYFDEMALYSNKNFYSADSVQNSVYQYSEPGVREYDSDYGYSIDPKTGKKYKLVISTNDGYGNRIRQISYNGNTSVLSDYFVQLSPQIIVNGAGVVELFFKEAEAEKKRYKEEEKRKWEELLVRNEAQMREQQFVSSRSGVRKAIAGIYYYWEFSVKENIWQSVAHVVGKINATVTAIENIGHTAGNFATGGAYAIKTLAILGRDFVEEKTKEGVKNTVTFVQKTTLALASSIPRESLTTLSAPNLPILSLNNRENNAESVVSSANRETPGTSSVPPSFPIPDILFPVSPGFGGGGGGPVLAVNNVVETPPENTEASPPSLPAPPESPPAVISDTTSPDISATISECASSLVSSSCVLGGGEVRLSWSSTATDISHFLVQIDGVLSATSTETEADLSLISGAHSISVIATDLSGNSATSTSLSFEYINRPIVINEIGWAGTASSSANEWIELFNNTSYHIDLSKIVLRAEDGAPELSLSGSIAPNSFFLIERTDDDSVPGVSGDLLLPFSGSGESSGLSNDGEKLLLEHKINDAEIVILDETPEISEECRKWCAGVSFGVVLRIPMARINPLTSGTNPENWRDGNTFFEPAGLLGSQIYGTPRGENMFSRSTGSA
ncbi:MAG: hypothetical protein AAB545_03310 [Patescibacteria group bacterium]